MLWYPSPVRRLPTEMPLLFLLFCLSSASAVRAETLLFEDSFAGRPGEGWTWRREHRESWRATTNGLEVRMEPGNMWGPANDARNLLLRPAPDTGLGEIEVSLNVSNQPTAQYEQVDLVWYYDDSHMVKLGQELVDGRLCIVMGREEKDRTRTIAIIPLDSFSVRLRLRIKDDQVRGQFRTPGGQWREAGACDAPAPSGGRAKISLQFYQGPPDVEHWARVSDFRVLRH